MQFLIISSVVVCSALAAPSTRTGSVNPSDGFAPFIAEANEAKKEMETLTQEERDALSKMFAILSDPSTTGAQKMTKIDDFVKDAPNETQVEVHAMAQTSTQLSDWLTTRLKQEDPVVAKVATDLVQLMLNMEFIMSTDAEKTAKVQSIVKGLTPTQIAALEQLDKDTTAEEKKLGMDTDK